MRHDLHHVRGVLVVHRHAECHQAVDCRQQLDPVRPNVRAENRASDAALVRTETSIRIDSARPPGSPGAVPLPNCMVATHVRTGEARKAVRLSISRHAVDARRNVRRARIAHVEQKDLPRM
jgi:hypothetical protein